MSRPTSSGSEIGPGSLMVLMSSTSEELLTLCKLNDLEEVSPADRQRYQGRTIDGTRGAGPNP
jgi:hypothetical protein